MALDHLTEAREMMDCARVRREGMCRAITLKSAHEVC